MVATPRPTTTRPVRDRHDAPDVPSAPLRSDIEMSLLDTRHTCGYEFGSQSPTASGSIGGATGLAGGDHLHFSMQLDGVQINPVEWFDAHWIQDRVFSKVAPAGVTMTAASSTSSEPAPARHKKAKGKRKR